MPFLYDPGLPTDLAPDPRPDTPIVAVRLHQGAAVSLAAIATSVPVSVKRTGDAAADDARVRAAFDAIAAGDFADLPHE